MITRRRAGLAAMAVATLALTAACGSSDNQSAGTTPTQDQVQPAGAGSDYKYGSSGSGQGDGYGGQAGGDSGAAPQSAPRAGTLALHQDAKLGPVVTDSKGMTLYRFDKDSAWPMKFGCNDACLDTWKPAKPADRSKLKGIPSKLISTVTRPDGLRQLAVDCWPVYTFTGDKQPGDINGQGKMGLWFAVSKEGKKITTTPEG
ncbi:hypothetical protein ABZ952_10840 [Micrococcus luteus]|uniref:hypothetical protein n=1 Tax=Micrococcus luteus TaxID=1270 RepID=UPI003409997A